MSSDTDSMLTYEDEMSLSDRLVNRRSVLESLDSETDSMSDSDQAIVDDGDRASTELVEAYLPFVWSTAYRIAMQRDLGGEYIHDVVKELVGEGTVAAIKCCKTFNARGQGDHPGVRFARYSYPAIAKAMKRYLAKQSTPYRVEVSRIQETWVYLSKESELELSLGRKPTAEEVYAETSIYEGNIERGLPSRSSFGSVDNEIVQNSVVSDEQEMSLDEWNTYLAAILETCLNEVVDDEVGVHAWLLYLGVDRGYPRENVEVAKMTRRTRAATLNDITTFNHLIIHPKYRKRLYDALIRLYPDLNADGLQRS